MNTQPHRWTDGFERMSLTVNGINTVLHIIGKGRPLVFLHGGGTFAGFEFARRWAGSHRVIVPYHPGFGESDDDPQIESVDDYLLHYLELFDALELADFDLVGHSMGGWFAAEFAARHAARLRNLVLIAPSGLVVTEVPTPDFFTIAGADMPGYLTLDPQVVLSYFPKEHDVEFSTQRYRETTSLARLCWDRPSGNPRLAKWLHRVRIPTLIVWGEGDRLIPPATANAWKAKIPNARVEIVRGAGHLVLEEKPEATDLVLTFLT